MRCFWFFAATLLYLACARPLTAPSLTVNIVFNNSSPPAATTLVQNEQINMMWTPPVSFSAGSWSVTYAMGPGEGYFSALWTLGGVLHWGVQGQFFVNKTTGAVDGLDGGCTIGDGLQNPFCCRTNWIDPSNVYKGFNVFFYKWQSSPTECSGKKKS